MFAKEEKSKGKKLIWIILTIIIIVLMFFSGSFRDKAQDLFKQTEKSLELIQSTDIPWFKDGEVKDYDGVIVNSNNKNITSYNLLGNQIWSKSIDFDSSLTHFGENTIYAADKDKGQIVAFNTQGEKLWTYDARQAINKIVERNGLLIIYTKAGEQIDQINILDEKGSLLANTVVDKGRLLSSNISNDRKKFALVTLDFSDNKLQSSLLLYTIEGELLWKKDFSNWVILDAAFIDNHTVLMISDTKIVSLNIENELLWSKELEGRLRDIDVNQKQKEIYLLYGESKDYIEVLEPNGKTKSKLALDNYYNNIYINKSNIFLTGEDRLIGIDNNKVFLNYKCKNKIENLVFEKGNILLFTEKNLLIGKLSNKKEEMSN